MSATVHQFTIDGLLIYVADGSESEAAGIVAQELADDCYGLSRIDFKAGDLVVDIGAHIGLFAIYAGLHFPEIVIHAFEPYPDNYELLRQNLERNCVKNVQAHNLALTGDGRSLEMVTNPYNSGGATSQSRTLRHGRIRTIPSTTLDRVFQSLGIHTCKLLKIDCEGSEYEILLSTRTLSRVEYLSGEFHTNGLLTDQGYTMEALYQHCQRYIAPGNLTVRPCRMSE